MPEGRTYADFESVNECMEGELRTLAARNRKASSCLV
uniref:Uncharacterized protein n=1 Tax=Oryzias sinensis TaxID=183150 RepID=A0A8C7X7T6_9TELE